MRDNGGGRFVVGDWVRRVRNSFHGMNPGDESIVKSMNGNGNIQLDKYVGNHDPLNFELVKESSSKVGKGVKMFKVGERLKQIKWAVGENPYVIVTKIEGNTVWHKHEGKSYSADSLGSTCDGFECFARVGKEDRDFEVGDRIRYPEGEAKIVFICSIYYHLLRDDKMTGGGIILEDGFHSWVYGRDRRHQITLVSRGKIKDKRIKYGESAIGLGLFVKNKVTGESGIVEDYKYEGRLYCYVRLFNGSSRVFQCSELEVLKEQSARKLRIRMNLGKAFMELHRDCLGTKEENDLIKLGCLVEIRNLKENGNLDYGKVGGRFVVFSVSGDVCGLDIGLGYEVKSIDKSRVRFVEDLAKDVKLKVSDVLIKSFEQFRGERSPVLLLGSNRKGIIDVVQVATNGAGCSALGEMDGRSFYMALKNLLLMKRKWEGFGVMFAVGHSGNAYRFSATARDYLLYNCYSPDKVYIGIGTDRIYPYKLYKSEDGRIHLVPIGMEVVGKSKGKEVK